MTGVSYHRVVPARCLLCHHSWNHLYPFARICPLTVGYGSPMGMRFRHHSSPSLQICLSCALNHHPSKFGEREFGITRFRRSEPRLLVYACRSLINNSERSELLFGITFGITHTCTSGRQLGWNSKRVIPSNSETVLTRSRIRTGIHTFSSRRSRERRTVYVTAVRRLWILELCIPQSRCYVGGRRHLEALGCWMPP